MRTALFGAATVAALAAGALATTGVFGSSHREAPRIMLDPSADNTDLYAFTAPDAPGKLTVISNWVPLQNPAGGPYFGKLDPEARYYVKIDNTGDGVEDVAYRWQFRNTFRNPNSFLYAVPPVNSIGDSNLNFVQTYDLYRERYRGGRVTDSDRIARNVPVAPDNVGPKTMPNYAAVAAGATQPLPGGGKTFVGPVDDPFFVDLGSIFDGINIDKPGRPGIGLGNQGGGKDDVSGFTVHSFALQVPAAEVTRDGRPVSGPTGANAVVGLWTTTERKAIKVQRGRVHDRWVQVSRLGNPLINEVVIPIGKKDLYNASAPRDDAKNFGAAALAPEPARILNQLFNLGIKETGRTDIVQALLTGVPGLTQIAKNAVPADTLKLNLGVPPAANPNRFGVLAGDTAGFPNGRRLADDVTDIELRVIAGALLKPEQGGKQIPLGDGIDVNDKPFRTTFPYVALPDSGFDAKFGRVEPAHAPVPQPPTP
ncbi:DUF4331 domain-containing protein [Solirubrobacter sp. CPCC 204708]|uniref:DUF4331 domain-containing protein n=1 Tax=Solirubrobacter deserti TaxID=2282478 RepID=A0ABT4RK75_9ACTN|nr:DUF4331 domain-containing protein [Solirubrobacter deserti]MBE2316827.1 DUF4331 domain-containing protein [Solirubrobacter deserti]MDA0138956.1 DUF4331 domain-containing protein [Solirubrobacter deserti]